MSRKILLSVDQLSVAREGKKLLDGVKLSIAPGEVHAIIGANGAGKSTLGKALVGHPSFVVTAGKMVFGGEDLLGLSPAERAQRGLFMAFQHPIAIRGVRNIDFLMTAINETRAGQALPPLGVPECLAWIKKECKGIGLGEAFLRRFLNDGFSGGEKKKNELLQMLVLKPKLAILDEIDSGLDISTRKLMGKMIVRLQQEGTTFIVITHYMDFFKDIKPDVVHIMDQGCLVQTGDASLVTAVLQEGYAELLAKNAREH